MPERRGLVRAGTAAVAMLAFAALAALVRTGRAERFDEALLLLMRDPADRSVPLGPLWFEEMVRDFSGLGGMGFLVVLSLAVAGFLLVARLPRAALLLVAAVGGGMLISTLLKLGFDRPRPDLVPHATRVLTASFPSGHSMMAATVYLTLGALIGRVLPGRRLRAYVMAACLSVTVLVGASRIYLGVHWPTDVLAGWLVGSAWALLCWTVMAGLQGVAAVEAPRRGA